MLTNIQREDVSRLTNTDLEVAGRIKDIRKLGKQLTFLQVELEEGTIQAVMTGSKNYEPHLEDIIKIEGKIKNNGQVRNGIPGYELEVNGISCLSPCMELPLTLPNTDNNRSTNIKNRHISLRNKITQETFKSKSDYLNALRGVLLESSFTEINTPSIVLDGTDGPVNAFKVDYFGKDAHLSISSMLYHHILISGGFNKIFEIRQMYRQDPSQTSNNLSEFLTLDFSAAYHTREDMMMLTEKLVHNAAQALEKRGQLKVQVPDAFPIITYRDLIAYIRKNGEDIGWAESHQLSKKYSKTISKLFPSFFWITDLPEESKAFYCSTKTGSDGKSTCNDSQLWFANNNVADGGERIINYNEAIAKLEKRGLHIANFENYLNALKHGIPPCTGIGIGVERLLMSLTGTKNILDTVLFPRNKQTYYP